MLERVVIIQNLVACQHGARLAAIHYYQLSQQWFSGWKAEILLGSSIRDSLNWSPSCHTESKAFSTSRSMASLVHACHMPVCCSCRIWKDIYWPPSSKSKLARHASLRVDQWSKEAWQYIFQTVCKYIKTEKWVWSHIQYKLIRRDLMLRRFSEAILYPVRRVPGQFNPTHQMHRVLLWLGESSQRIVCIVCLAETVQRIVCIEWQG